MATLEQKYFNPFHWVMAFMLLSILMLTAGTLAGTSTYAIPTSVPTSAAVLDPAPVGISYVSIG